MKRRDLTIASQISCLYVVWVAGEQIRKRVATSTPRARLSDVQGKTKMAQRLD